MDAAAVGDRKLMECRPRTLEEKMVAEGMWASSFYEPQRWIKNMAAWGYAHIGTYQVDKDLELYRFELDESKRSAIPVGRTFECHFQNVLLRPSLKAYTDKVNEDISFVRR